jgi:hypothetical protein
MQAGDGKDPSQGAGGLESARHVFNLSRIVPDIGFFAISAAARFAQGHNF